MGLYATDVVNKAEIARLVYNEQEALAAAKAQRIVRKDVVKLIAQRANLSPAGAQTYYQTIKKNKAKLDSGRV